MNLIQKIFMNYLPDIHIKLTKTGYIITVDRERYMTLPRRTYKGVFILQTSDYTVYSETTTLDDGSYKVTFFRNADGACPKEDATAAIVHMHDIQGRLVSCEYVSY